MPKLKHQLLKEVLTCSCIQADRQLNWSLIKGKPTWWWYMCVIFRYWLICIQVAECKEETVAVDVSTLLNWKRKCIIIYRREEEEEQHLLGLYVREDNGWCCLYSHCSLGVGVLSSSPTTVGQIGTFTRYWSCPAIAATNHTSNSNTNTSTHREC